MRATWCRRPISGRGRASRASAATPQFTTWLYRITANTAYTTVKRRRRHRADALDAMLEEPVETRIDAQPEESAEQSAMLARLAGALGQLPPKLRVLVVLKDVYGLSHEEIGEELGISVAAAKVRLHRGRKRLRDLLYDDGRHEGHEHGKRWDRAV